MRYKYNDSDYLLILANFQRGWVDQPWYFYKYGKRESMKNYRENLKIWSIFQEIYEYFHSFTRLLAKLKSIPHIHTHYKDTLALYLLKFLNTP